MEQLKTFRLKFRTGYDGDIRYFMAKDKDLQSATDQLFKMYCSVNTELLGAKEISK